MAFLSPKEIHDLEQCASAIKEHYVLIIKEFFEGCLNNDFTREEALSLTKTFITTLMPKS